jgi:hypothetical protein
MEEEAMDAGRVRWPAALAGAVFVALGTWRLLQALALAGLPEPAALVLLALVGEGVAAVVAGLALIASRAQLALAALVAFTAFVALQMAADTAVYGIRSVLEALVGMALALLLALLGWLAARASLAPARRM